MTTETTKSEEKRKSLHGKRHCDKFGHNYQSRWAGDFNRKCEECGGHEDDE